MDMPHPAQRAVEMTGWHLLHGCSSLVTCRASNTRCCSTHDSLALSLAVQRTSLQCLQPIGRPRLAVQRAAQQLCDLQMENGRLQSIADVRRHTSVRFGTAGSTPAAAEQQAWRRAAACRQVIMQSSCSQPCPTHLVDPDGSGPRVNHELPQLLHHRERGGCHALHAGGQADRGRWAGR